MKGKIIEDKYYMNLVLKIQVRLIKVNKKLMNKWAEHKGYKTEYNKEINIWQGTEILEN